MENPEQNLEVRDNRKELVNEALSILNQKGGWNEADLKGLDTQQLTELIDLLKNTEAEQTPVNQSFVADPEDVG